MKRKNKKITVEKIFVLDVILTLEKKWDHK